MKKRPLCAICVLFLVIQAVRVLFFGVEDMEASALEKLAHEETGVSLTGRVYKIEKKERVTAFYLKDNAVSAAGGDIAESSVLVYFSGGKEENEIEIGNVLRVDGTAQVFDAARNPGNFDQRKYYKLQGIHVLIWADRAEVLSADRDRIRQGLYEFRLKWDRLLVRYLGEYYGGTMSAILLGEKGGLDPEMKTMYQKCGISHLLAISGLHMTFLGMGIYNLFRRCGFGFAVSGTAGAALLILYSMMIGAGVSSLRALIMFIVRIGAEITGRDYDLLTSLALSAAVLCGWRPLYLTDAGFLLSYGAILGIAVYAPVFSDMFAPAGKGWKRRIIRWFFDSLATSLGVNVLLLGPLLWFYFEIPPYSVFLNLIVIPLMPAAMGAGLAGSALAAVWDIPGGCVLGICRAVLAGYDLLCRWCSLLPLGRFVAGKPEMYQLAVYYLILGAVYMVYRYLKKREEKRLCRVPGMALLLVAVTMAVMCRALSRDAIPARGVSEITVLDVGQGDCIHVRGPSLDILIDGGSSDVSDAGTYRIEPYLLCRAADRLDYVFVTHGDQDHISGIRGMLTDQEFGIEICNLVLPPQEYHDDMLRELMYTAAAAGTRILIMEPGDRISDNGLELECLAPGTEAGLEPGNEASLVLEASYGGFRMLLTGDVEGPGEQALIKSGRLEKCDVLKAAHHGSGNSGSEEFLKITQPAVSVISAGRDNRYGHPHPDTTKRLKECGSSIYSTQENGAITICTDGRKIRITGTVSDGV